MSYTGNQTNSKDFLDILQALKKNIMKDCNVAEVAVVNQIGTESVTCKICNTDESVVAYPVQGLTLEVGDVVVLIFCNTDFRTNLERLKNGAGIIENSEIPAHSKSYGIILSILYRKEEQET